MQTRAELAYQFFHDFLASQGTYDDCKAFNHCLESVCMHCQPCDSDMYDYDHLYYFADGSAIRFCYDWSAGDDLVCVMCEILDE